MPDAPVTQVDYAPRLRALRNEMQIFEADGFIIPRADEHQGEYVAPHSERLKWLTGFSGSAGFAIVLQERAALFIDGRYTLQVTQEADGDLFDFCHVTEEPADKWLALHLKEGMKLAYDPWLHTGAGLHRMKAAAKKIGAELVAAPHNFVDAIWADRPEPPTAPMCVHELEYAGKPHGEKLADIADMLVEDKQDCVFLSLPDSIAWAFNVRGGDIPCTPVSLGFALVYKDATAALFFPEGKIGAEVIAHLGNKVAVYGREKLSEHLDHLGVEKKTVRLEGKTAPKWVHDRLKAKGATVAMGDDPCALPKACKNAVELAGMQQAHIRDGAAMVRFLCWLSEQPYSTALNELSVSDKLDSLRAEDDLFHDYSFPTISGAASNGAIVHYRVTAETSLPLPENGLYLVDSGGQYKDGTTDITRTIGRGIITDEMKDRFTRVLKGHIAISSARFPKGTTGSQLDILARQPLWQVGLDYDHGTGHGVGSFLNVHEGPHRISKMGSTVGLQPGMVVSNEPGFYKNGYYGIRIENLIYVRELPRQNPEEREMYGFDELTICPIDKNCIDKSLLTSGEIDWLNSYHVRVLEILRDLVNEKERAWLIEACLPL